MERIGRNTRCPCGGGLKYKHCCLPRNLRQQARRRERQSARPGTADELHALGIRALQSGDYELAIELVRNALKTPHPDPSAYNTLGLAYAALGRSDDAILCYRFALALDPNFAAASGNLGIALLAQGRIDEAIGQFRHALSCHPESAEALNNLGNALACQGKVDEGLQFLRKAVSIAPDYALAYSNMGNALGAAGRPADAIACHETALELEPDHPKWLANLGKALSNFGKIDEAAAAYRRAVHIDSGFAEAYNSLGVALMELGELEESRANLRSAIALRPDFAEAHYNLHSVLLWPGSTSQAIEALRQVVALRPEDDLAACHLGIAMDSLGDAAGAARYLSDADMRSPDARAALDSYRYIRSAGGPQPVLVGCPQHGFRIGMAAAKVEGLVLEFGVRFGVSIRQIAALSNQLVHGFDSFEGLPEAWHEEPRGNYSTAGAVPAVPAAVSLHRGWFEDTLPPFKQAHPG
ncbi:MAG: tetratricopeptide repeat protein, partial [Burkholderiales bacterium]